MPTDKYLNKIVLNKMTREQFENLTVKKPDEFYAITDKDSELNNPFSLLDYKFSEYELNNASWLRSQGQYNLKAVYPAVYDLLLKIYNGTETKAGVSVKLSTETFTDYDFVLNTVEETFRLPVKVKLASGKAVVGNGMALGFYDGSSTFALASLTANGGVASESNHYGKPVGQVNVSGFNVNSNKSFGITTDAEKSGIETSDSDLYLYFYVGETVQNANLINAGRIEEKLVDKVDYANTQWAINALMPDYSAGISISSLPYTAPTDGLAIICGNVSNGAGSLFVNGKAVSVMDTNAGLVQMIPIKVSKNDVISTTIYGGATIPYTRNDRNEKSIFYPLKGAN